jgi:hypothetical protein
MAKVRQRFDATKLENIKSAILEGISHKSLDSSIKPAMSIAVTAGSRGIANMVEILGAVVDFLKSRGTHPFLVPAMGSHAGATAHGQVAQLSALGITEQSIGAPIRATMEVEEVARLEDGTPVYMDAIARKADGIVVVNRTKYHTLFTGRYESGLMKMLVVGLGKQSGADVIHCNGPANMSRNIERFGRAILQNAPVLFGVTPIENSLDETCALHVLRPEERPEEEPRLLLEAKKKMPRILFQDLDLLIVDRIGKNISGSGMDPNITGAYSVESGIPRTGAPKRICVLDVTEETHGCVMGVGNADTTTKRLYEKISFDATYPNALTVGVLSSSKIPPVFDNQELAIKAAIKTILGVAPEALRVIRIRDTVHLEEIWVSQSLMREAHSNPHVEVLGVAEQLFFDQNGNLF